MDKVLGYSISAKKFGECCQPTFIPTHSTANILEPSLVCRRSKRSRSKIFSTLVSSFRHLWCEISSNDIVIWSTLLFAHSYVHACFSLCTEVYTLETTFTDVTIANVIGKALVLGNWNAPNRIKVMDAVHSNNQQEPWILSVACYITIVSGSICGILGWLLGWYADSLHTTHFLQLFWHAEGGNQAEQAYIGTTY